MHLSRLSLTNFRNYGSVKLELSPSPVIFAGRNGAGKTNLLEAISFLIPGRGIRRASLSDIDREANGQGWGVSADIESRQGIISITTGRESGAAADKRIAKVDGKAIKLQSELSKMISILWLIPAMDGLFLESDSSRRKFLDRLVFSFDTEHAGRVSAFEHAMRERTKLLEQPSFDPQWVTLLEQNMAELGVAMAKARRETVKNLNITIAKSKLSFPKAHITLQSLVDDALEAGREDGDIIAEAKEKYAKMRLVDAAAGRSTVGVHRTNMQAFYQDKNRAAANCSTGEQKALLLSIILGQAQAVREHKGAAPILLLDEVVAHLDESRRAELADAILEQNIQAFLTGTDMVFFDAFNTSSQRFAVDAGNVRKRP